MINKKSVFGDWVEQYLPDSTVINAKAKQEGLPEIRTDGHIEASLDVHGMTSAECKVVVLSFLKMAKKNRLRKILIVHGKGLNSEKGGVLGPLVSSILSRHPDIVRFHAAAPRLGGSGAVLVHIKI